MPAHEQGTVKVLFQQFHLAADRGFADIQLLRRGGKTFQLGGHLKRDEVFQTWQGRAVLEHSRGPGHR